MPTFHLLKSGSPIRMVIILLAYCLKHNTDKDFIVLIKMIKEAVNDLVQVEREFQTLVMYENFLADVMTSNLNQTDSYQKNFKVYKLQIKLSNVNKTNLEKGQKHNDVYLLPID